MANKWMGDLIVGVTPLIGDYAETLQGADTEVKKITWSQLIYGLIFAQGRRYPVRVVTAAGAVTVTAADYYVGINKTTGAATVVNLPASPNAGTTFVIKDEKLDAATNNITITPAAGNIIGSTSATTYVMNANGQAATITYNGTAWVVT